MPSNPGIVEVLEDVEKSRGSGAVRKLLSSQGEGGGEAQTTRRAWYGQNDTVQIGRGAGL